MAEILKTKETTETLFVGVGGIGSDIVAQVASMCKGNELKNIRFAVLDTDANSLKTVESGGASITKVQTSSSQTVKEYLDKDDNARLFWFPNNSTLYGKTVSEGAGQVRAISRLALNNAVKTGEISKLYKEIDNLLLKDSGNFKQALRIVVVSSATGGTGSGMAMITAMLIREYLHDHYSEKKAIIRGFFVLPSVMDTVIDSQMERNSQYRNGYATIKEINAMMMMASGFGETEDELKRYKDLHITVPTPTGETRQLNCLPFDFCFLMEAADKNSEGMQSLEDYKRAAARCIYEQSIGPMQARSFSLEDNIIKEFASKEKFGRNRFAGIGASRIVYPYEDVADYIAYDRALKRIGGTESTGDWSAYDKAFEKDWAEYKAKRSFTNEEKPTVEQSFIGALYEDNSLFGKDIRDNICGSSDPEDVVSSVEEKVTAYLNNLQKEVKGRYINNEKLYSKTEQIKNFEYTYEQKDQPMIDLKSLRTFYQNIESRADRFAKNIARSIFMGAPNILSDDVESYHLETLLKFDRGAVHPTSSRYILYSLKLKLKERHEGIKSRRKTQERSLMMYAKDYKDENGTSPFDVVAKYSPKVERNIDELIKLAKEDRSFWQQHGDAFGDIWDKVGTHMHKYAELLLAYMESKLYDTVYQIADTYIDSLCEEYKKFYDSFSSKTVTLVRKKEDIVEGLGNRKGAGNYYLCATEDKLEELCNRIPEGKHGFLLPEKLSAKIFESIKTNAETSRMKVYDKYAEGRVIDIFDENLIEHFRDEVREDGKEKIDINVVQAAFLDKELAEYIEKKTFDGEDGVESRRLDDQEKISELKEIMRKGLKLSTPGINGQSFVEPRDVKICTFNTALLEMRDVDLKSQIQSHKVQSVPSETVSKYEMRFFTAIYNITPDDIPLFKGPKRDKISGETDHSAEGIYFKAYQNYGKLIGPDSMKSATISTHIDKRWDAVVCLPELNFGVQYDEMVKAHSALLYGLIFNLIRKFPSSQYDKEKKVFKLVNEEGGRIDLIVSNGTDCDEFYEVLDALYRDKASANMIMEVAEEYSRTDVEKNNNYMQSAFFEFLKSFKIPGSHSGETSLFEVPLVYYNSLPSALTDNNELSIMIDSVIQIITLAVNRHEREQDRNAYICKLLEDQYKIFIESFKNDEYNEKYDLRKNTNLYDNIVASMVCAKIINKFKEVEISNYSERVKALRKEIAIPDDVDA